MLILSPVVYKLHKNNRLNVCYAKCFMEHLLIIISFTSMMDKINEMIFKNLILCLNSEFETQIDV